MARELTSAARAAKMIKEELKKRGIACSVKSKNYSMGNSVDVYVNDLDPETFRDIDQYCSQFQYGSFDGMTDCYNYTNSRNDIPQSKYVSVHNEFSYDMRQKAWEALRGYCKEAEELPENLKDVQASAFFWNSYASHHVWYVLSGNGSYDELSKKFWDSMKKEQPKKGTPAEDKKDGVTRNEEKNGIEIRFDAKPCETTIAALKANGWRWSRFNKCWYNKDAEENYSFALSISGVQQPVTEPSANLPAIIEEIPEPNFDDCKEVIRSADIKKMVEERDEKVKQHLYCLEYMKDHSINLNYILYDGNTSMHDEKTTIHHIDRDYWRQLFEKSGLATYLSHKKRREFRDTIYNDRDVPEFSPDNIQATVENWINLAPGEFEEAVCDVFRSLSWHYKTNSPVLFGDRIIYEYAIQTGYYKNPITSYASKWDSISDLIRVMKTIDRKPIPEYQNELKTVVEGKMNWGEWLEVPELYVDVKPFKKGTLHIKFRRPELVTGLNKIIGKRYPNALPATN